MEASELDVQIQVAVQALIKALNDASQLRLCALRPFGAMAPAF